MSDWIRKVFSIRIGERKYKIEICVIVRIFNCCHNIVGKLKRIKNIQKVNQINILRKYPITSFIILTFLFSYVLGMPFNMWVSQNSIIPKPFDIYLSRLITVLSPGISAIILIWNRKKRIKLNYFSSTKSGKCFYVLIPIVTLLLSVISLTSAGFSRDLIVTTLKENWGQLLIHLVLQVVIIGFGEELGWRGWLLPISKEKILFTKGNDD